jgi:type I restriction enzyme, S subunit
MREYRTRLIADVVTGKVDVRDAAAGLPAAEDLPAEEPEAEEDEGAAAERGEEEPGEVAGEAEEGED